MLSQSESDNDFLAQVPEHIIIEFCSYAYQKDYVASNPRLFHTRHWVNVPALRAFISQRYGDQDQSESILSTLEHEPQTTVKLEEDCINLTDSTPPHTRIVQENGQEVVEICSSSDEGSKNSDLTSESDTSEDSDMDLSSDPESDTPENSSHMDTDEHHFEFSDAIKPTVWLDKDVETIKLEYNNGQLISITKQAKVEVVEYLRGIPMAWPVPERPTTYVLDLSDARYNLHDKFGQQYSVDALIKNKDRDSWGSTNGKADSLTRVLNVFGPSIWACEHADPNLINVTCRELDPDANHHLIEAQVSAHKEEGTTPISAAIAYVYVFSFLNVHLLSFSFFNSSHSSWKCESGSVLTGHGKLSHESKDTYRKLVKAAGIWGTSVQQVENASSTKVILEGKTPSTYDKALKDHRRKKDLVREVKVQQSPGGLGIIGACQQLLKESLNKPITKRYIQGIYFVGPHMLVLTFDAFLLSLIHDAMSFEVDHTFKAINEFRHLVPHKDYQHLMNFPYMKKEELPEFDMYIKSLKNKKISAWWKHKHHSKWILPTIMESMSCMHLDDWRVTPFTTNAGEAQHHWTNSQTGIKLTLVDAINKACEVDREMSLKIKETLETGFAESHCNIQHRMEIIIEQLAQKESQQCEAEMKERLRSMQSSISPTKKKAHSKRFDDSTGRVKTKRTSREAARKQRLLITLVTILTPLQMKQQPELHHHQPL
ncbi:hypothetical protein BDQ17DRAFT_1431274 [Cyathus striatus]|nr:hypothetical protein BDQ17DRAFT_1431274 [Cyathus striatus]